VTVREAEIISRPEFIGWPPDLPPLERATDTHIPRQAVAELPRGRVVGRSRAVITGQNDLVWEVSRYFGSTHPRQHPVFSNPRPGPPRPVAGRLGVLAAQGDINYYHFLIDVIPRLGVLALAAELEPPDAWYAPATSRFQSELLQLVGIDDDQRVDSNEVPHVRADTLIVPSVPSTWDELHPPWAVGWLRHHLLDQRTLPTERVPTYIVRTAGTHNRAVRNEAALLSFLRDRGFRVLDPSQLSVVEQIEAFATASVIVSPHGAALANLVFASPGTMVIEIFPAGCVLPLYWRLASGVPGLHYRWLSSWTGAHRSKRAGALVSDIEVDLKGLATLLDEVPSI
jgi:capsular polysaccharide biosynthesis protein